MRVSTQNLYNNRMVDVAGAAARFASVQTRMGTGKRILRPSDDPAGLGESLGLRATVAGIEQFQRNGQAAKGFLGAGDVAVEQALSLVRQARQYAVQGASDTLDITARNGLATQVEHIIDQLGGIANSKFGARYIFAGQRTTQQPFAPAVGGGFSYQGGSAATGDDALTVEIAPADNLNVNASGDRVFSGVFASLIALRDHLNSGQAQLISNSDLRALDASLNTLSTTRAEFGAKIQRLDQTGQRLEQTRLDITTAISQIEDADIPSTVVDLKTAETAYQAALAATARGFQQSLADFLR